MALPRILQKLFQNGGAGPRLLRAIMPEGVVFSVNGNAPDGSGNVAVDAGDAMEADILSAADKAVDGTVTNVGSTDMADILSALSRLEAQIRVVETWKSGGEWYRKWSDGWIEQGGWTSDGATTTLHVPFSDTHYTLLATASVGSGETKATSELATERTTTTFIMFFTTSGYSGRWYACGY